MSDFSERSTIMLKKIKEFFARLTRSSDRDTSLEDPNRLSDEKAEFLRSKHTFSSDEPN